MIIYRNIPCQLTFAKVTGSQVGTVFKHSV